MNSEKTLQTIENLCKWFGIQRQTTEAKNVTIHKHDIHGFMSAPNMYAQNLFSVDLKLANAIVVAHFWSCLLLRPTATDISLVETVERDWTRRRCLDNIWFRSWNLNIGHVKGDWKWGKLENSQYRPKSNEHDKGTHSQAEEGKKKNKKKNYEQASNGKELGWKKRETFAEYDTWLRKW